MKRIFTTVFVLLSSILLSFGSNTDDAISEIVEPITSPVVKTIFYAINVEVMGEKIGIPLVLIWLVAGAIFCTIYFKFINVKGFKTAINIVRGKYTDPNDKGEVSHFQALTTALSGTVGLGNIAGVAVAISLGGPGATFWMIVAGLLGMSSKFVECTLGVKFREIAKDGTVHGGPMYYLRKIGVKDSGIKQIDQADSNLESSGSIGKFLAGFFAVACIFGSFGGGNMFQANQAHKQLSTFLDNEWLINNGWAFGLIMAVVVSVVIIGGIKSIAKVTDKIVPFMCGVYVLAALVIIFFHFSDIPKAFGAIISGAFAPTAVAGGIVGVLIQGFRRAAFSNEAGIGSASIAHSAVKTNDPASEGIVALLEPFIDTVVVCTMTALVLVITGFHDNSDFSGVQLTSAAFGSVFGSFAEVVLTIAVVLFAFSTMISWSYYGLQAWQYLFGYKKYIEIAYKAVFCVCVIVGSSLSLGPVIDFSDAMIFAMSIPNMIGLIILAPVVKAELDKYLVKIKNKK